MFPASRETGTRVAFDPMLLFVAVATLLAILIISQLLWVALRVLVTPVAPALRK